MGQLNSAATTGSAQASKTNKSYKLMKSAERGELNSHSMMKCQAHDMHGNLVQVKSPCTCAK